MERLRRTMLFIPGNNPGMLQNAGILGADTVILDLEDAVSIAEKDSARILVRSAIKNVNFYDTEIVVRINPLTTEYGREDVYEIGSAKPGAILVPKATSEDMEEVDEMLSKVERKNGFKLGSIKLFALVESAFGVENVYEIIKSSKRIIGVLLGAEDLTADLGIKRTKVGEEIFYARSKVSTACRALRVDSIDTPFADMEDREGFIKDIGMAKSLGFTGKAAINPRQVDIIHEVFAPTEDEIRSAKKIIEAMEEAEREGKGVFSLDGKMVDAPIIARAQNTINKAKLSGLI
jgi:citrate lyase subunit beta / citryl-CoA lyase